MSNVGQGPSLEASEVSHKARPDVQDESTQPTSQPEPIATGDELDARRYRWLRKQNWYESALCVVARPKDAVKLGHDCPSLFRLDEAIDAAIEGERP